MKSAIFPLLALLFLLCLLVAGCAGQGLTAGLTPTVAPTAALPVGATETVEPTETAVLTTSPTVESTQTAAATPLPTVQVTAVATSMPIILPSATPTIVSASSPSSPTALKYQLIAQFGEPFFCDPDQYPVAREVTQQLIDQRVAALQQQNPDEFQVILQHLGLTGPSLTDQQKQLVYAEAKKLNAIAMQPAGTGYTFNLRVQSSGKQGTVISGTINSSGTISVTQQQPTVLICPICLAVNTLIETPNGAVPVQDLKQGMAIWTTDASGARRAAVVLQTISRPVPSDFLIVQLRLADGREILASPNHPTVDGRTVGELGVGDMLDGARVVNITLVPYSGATYDILPSGESGTYWANGILLKSTLAK